LKAYASAFALFSLAVEYHPRGVEYMRAQENQIPSIQLNQMKKILVTTLMSALAVSALAQATVNLPLSGDTRPWFIQYTTDGTTLTKFPSGDPATLDTWGNLYVTVYYASAGTASPFTADNWLAPIPTTWEQSTRVLHRLWAPGANPSTTFTLADATGGSSVQAFIVGWTGDFADWNTALASGTSMLAYSGSTLSGGALSWLQGTGDPLGIPPTMPVFIETGPLGYDGLVFAVIPEPSMFALAGLGAAALMILRRRR